MCSRSRRNSRGKRSSAHKCRINARRQEKRRPAASAWTPSSGELVLNPRWAVRASRESLRLRPLSRSRCGHGRWHNRRIGTGRCDPRKIASRARAVAQTMESLATRQPRAP
jgi:hypothetical protein